MITIILLLLVIGVILCTLAALGTPGPLFAVGWVLICIAVLLYAIPLIHLSGGSLFHNG